MTPVAEKIRLGVAIGLVGVGFAGISARLAYLHLGPHDHTRIEVAKNRYHEKNFRGARGRILDRSGRIMALDLGRANVTADASYFCTKHTNSVDRIKILRALSNHLQMDLAMVKNMVLPEDGELDQYIMLKRAVSVDVAENIRTEIRTNNIKGVMVEPITKRFYPHKNLLSHVVGFSNVLGDGCGGVELVMDQYLKGKAGIRTGQKDGRKHELYNHRDQYIMLKRAVSVDVAENIRTEIRTNNIKGVMVEPITKRFYPHKNLLSHVVGFSNVLGDGCGGVELVMDQYLKGKAGIRTGQKDGRKHELYNHRDLEIDARAGGSVFLTIDQYLQFHVERELEAAMSNFNAKGAWAMIMDVKSGDILAMASKPDYDLNAYSRTPLETMRNQNVAMLYEPGSTVKPIVIAAALNDGVTHPDELIFCENKAWSYAGRILHDFHGYGDLSVADVLKKSSNIGTAKVALRLGDQRLDEYLRRFGFGDKTGIQLPGEQVGIFRPAEKWKKISITRIAMGHEISQTALQVLCAINTIANNGFRVKPRLIDRIEDSEGQLIHRFDSQVVDNPISVETAKLVQKLMARITEEGGTGRRAAMENYTVAVKTGTAEKVVNGRYDRSKNVASMVGFLPAEAPQISMIVVVDEPQPLHTGGVVAGPVFKNIAEKAVRILNVPPSPAKVLESKGAQAVVH